MAAPKSTKSIIQVQLKLKLRPSQERMLNRWLWHLTGVYNWTVRKIELDANDHIYRSPYEIEALLRGQGKKIGLPTHTMQRTARTAIAAWRRRFSRLGGKPRLKGRRNRLNSIPSPGDGISLNREMCVVKFPIIGRLRFHRRVVPSGTVKASRLIRRASGWYACICIQAEPSEIALVGNRETGIDPGFSSLLTLSSGQTIDHPKELARTADRLAQSQRGHDRRLTSRLLERQANQRKDRNHKLSRRLVSENALIAWSKDSHAAIAKRFGKSVAGAAHGQLRSMLAYKCRAGGRQFVEVSGRYSTMTCSACGARSGPTGYAGLSVRRWTCGCGAEHDRDVNAAINTLNAARGLRVESGREVASGIATRVKRRRSQVRDLLRGAT